MREWARAINRWAEDHLLAAALVLAVLNGAVWTLSFDLRGGVLFGVLSAAFWVLLAPYRRRRQS
jgi:hypothetical protein